MLVYKLPMVATGVVHEVFDWLRRQTPPDTILQYFSHPRTIPTLMQISVSETSIPLTSGGASSVMYTGAITIAHPTPIPVTTRPSSRKAKVWLIVIMVAPVMNTKHARPVVGLRPRRSAAFPASSPPNAATILRDPTIPSYFARICTTINGNLIKSVQSNVYYLCLGFQEVGRG